MATNYPVSLDVFSTKVDGVDDVLAADINKLQDAVLAIQTKLGAASGQSALGALALTSGNAPGNFAGILRLRNTGGGGNTATSIDAELHSVNVGSITFTDTGDGGCQVNIAYTPPGNASVDRREFGGLVVDKNGVVKAKGFLPYAAGAVGTLGLLRSFTGSGGQGVGTTLPGSELYWSDAGGGGGGNPSGTWMSLGSFTRNGSGGFGVTLWIRIA